MKSARRSMVIGFVLLLGISLVSARVWAQDAEAFVYAGWLGASDVHNSFAGAGIGDFDGDGDLDLFLVGETRQVLLNDGSGSFQLAQQVVVVEKSLEGSCDSGGPAVGDIDGDGDLDVVVSAGQSSPYHELWLNDGSGQFQYELLDAVGL